MKCYLFIIFITIYFHSLVFSWDIRHFEDKEYMQILLGVENYRDNQNLNLKNYLIFSRINTKEGFVSEIREGIYESGIDTYVYKSKLSANMKTKVWYFESILCKNEKYINIFVSDGSEPLETCYFSNKIKLADFLVDDKKMYIIEDKEYKIYPVDFDKNMNLYKKIKKEIFDNKSKKLLYLQEKEIRFINDFQELNKVYKSELLEKLQKYWNYSNGIVSKVKVNDFYNFSDDRALHNE